MCIGLVQVLKLLLKCFLQGSVVEAAPQAQPKTTCNAQKDFVQLRILPGTFSNVVHELCALPVPLSEKVYVLRAFSRVPLLVAKGWPKSFPRGSF